MLWEGFKTLLARQGGRGAGASRSQVQPGVESLSRLAARARTFKPKSRLGDNVSRIRVRAAEKHRDAFALIGPIGA
jgi:hypothetical protein